MNKTCIIIAGPTGVGKTAVAVELAKKLSTEIISADSRQCYRELNIAVSKPSAEELAAVPHHFINSHSVHDTVTAADFERFALDAVQGIFEKHDVAIMAGGTGLYIKAFTDGLDPIPAADPALRAELDEGHEQGGLSWLQEKIKELDPEYASKGDMQNPRRIMRALEVFITSGKSILTFHTSPKTHRDFNIIRIALELPREELYERINIRVDQMMQAGLLEEARSLHGKKELPALQTVGYAELFDFFEGKVDLDRAVELIKQNTRHYAKRQLTWFRHQGDFVFCPPRVEEILRLLKGYGE